MTEKNSRKVVIIDRVKSDIIDQAILILKSSVPQEISIARNAPVVTQAQTIIDDYIARVERMRMKTEKRKKKYLYRKRLCQLSISVAAFGVTLLAAFAAGWILNAIF